MHISRLIGIVSVVLLSTLVLVDRANAGATQNFIVLYHAKAVPNGAASAVKQAGGTLVASYGQIGVVIARSDNDAFAADLMNDSRIESVVATTSFAAKIRNTDPDDEVNIPVISTPAPGSDNLSGLQWDMVQIHAPEARAITGGSSAVVVGDIGTGVDWTHPDLAPNVDFAHSVSCVGGVPNTDPAAWFDDNGLGTATAGIIAAAKNGIGIVGVAPNVKIAAIKAGNGDGYFFPEAVVCAFMWAGTHKLQVTNNSYFADPYQFNCVNDPLQRAIWKAEQRAITYAMQRGVTVVAAFPAYADDLAHPTQDAISPDNSTPVLRDITNACRIVPVEVSGVIGVTANGNLQLKSFYSSYGVGAVQVIAPGGDSILQRTAAAPNGRVLSTFPTSRAADCARKVFDGAALYCYLQGTAVASPHVAGVAALIVSTGITSPGAVAAQISNTADAIPCPPDLSIYSFYPSFDNGAPQLCQGGFGYNGFNGHGQVNALAAVTE